MLSFTSTRRPRPFLKYRSSIGAAEAACGADDRPVTGVAPTDVEGLAEEDRSLTGRSYSACAVAKRNHLSGGRPRAGAESDAAPSRSGRGGSTERTGPVPLGTRRYAAAPTKAAVIRTAGIARTRGGYRPPRGEGAYDPARAARDRGERSRYAPARPP